MFANRVVWFGVLKAWREVALFFELKVPSAEKQLWFEWTFGLKAWNVVCGLDMLQIVATFCSVSEDKPLNRKWTTEGLLHITICYYAAFKAFNACSFLDNVKFHLHLILVILLILNTAYFQKHCTIIIDKTIIHHLDFKKFKLNAAQRAHSSWTKQKLRTLILCSIISSDHRAINHEL